MELTKKPTFEVKNTPYSNAPSGPELFTLVVHALNLPRYLITEIYIYRAIYKLTGDQIRATKQELCQSSVQSSAIYRLVVPRDIG